jgi:hypothetical protein
MPKIKQIPVFWQAVLPASPEVDWLVPFRPFLAAGDSHCLAAWPAQPQPFAGGHRRRGKSHATGDFPLPDPCRVECARVTAANRSGHVAAVGLESGPHAVRDPRRYPEAQAGQMHGRGVPAVSACRKGIRAGTYDCRVRVGVSRRGDSLCRTVVGQQDVLRGAAEALPRRKAAEIPQIDGVGGRDGRRSVSALTGECACPVRFLLSLSRSDPLAKPEAFPTSV